MCPSSPLPAVSHVCSHSAAAFSGEPRELSCQISSAPDKAPLPELICLVSSVLHPCSSGEPEGSSSILRAAAARACQEHCNESPVLIPLLLSTDSRAGEEGAIRSVDHAVVGGVVAVVVFAMLCLLIILGRYFARHKGKTETKAGG